MWPTALTPCWATVTAQAASNDKIGAAATAKVKYVLASAVVCSVKAADMGQTGLPPVDPATGLPFGSEEDAIAF